MVRFHLVAFLAALGTVVGSAPAAAQPRSEPFSPPRFWAGIEFHGGNGVGEFGDMIDGIWGFELVGRWVPNRRSRLLYRLDLGLLTYGEERLAVCLDPPIGCRIGVEMTTSNDIAFAGAGPEIRFLGDRLYLFGTLGLSYFSTSTSLSGASVSEDLLTTENFSDTAFALRFGGGWRILVKKRGRPVRIDIGGEYHHNGVAEYLREGDIIDQPDGTLTLVTTRSEANLVTFRLGVSIGLGLEAAGGG